MKAAQKGWLGLGAIALLIGAAYFASMYQGQLRTQVAPLPSPIITGVYPAPTLGSCLFTNPDGGAPDENDPAWVDYLQCIADALAQQCPPYYTPVMNTFNVPPHGEQTNIDCQYNPPVGAPVPSAFISPSPLPTPPPPSGSCTPSINPWEDTCRSLEQACVANGCTWHQVSGSFFGPDTGAPGSYTCTCPDPNASPPTTPGHAF